MWRRNIQERVELLAPFLRFDRDPYVVVAEDGIALLLASLAVLGLDFILTAMMFTI